MTAESCPLHKLDISLLIKSHLKHDLKKQMEQRVGRKT